MNIYNRVVILAEQDALKSFDPGAVTAATQDPSILKALFISVLICAILVVIAIILNFISKTAAATVPMVVLGVSVLFFTGMLTSFGVSANNLNNANKEFTQWSKDRYNVEINADQYSTLNQITGWHNGSGFSDPVLTNSGFVKAWIENGRITLMIDDEKSKELPLSESLSKVK